MYKYWGIQLIGYIYIPVDEDASEVLDGEAFEVDPDNRFGSTQFIDAHTLSMSSASLSVRTPMFTMGR